MVVNALSVDVEDWFQVGAFEKVIDRADWDSLEHRVEEQEALLRRVLILLVDWVENPQEPAYHRTHAA